jgi:hypothetical protein
MREESIAGDVEGNAKTHVARALIQLARELAVGNVELKLLIFFNGLTPVD